jgi:hypothetical protein
MTGKRWWARTAALTAATIAGILTAETAWVRADPPSAQGPAALASTMPVSPRDGDPAYAYHLDGNLDNSGTAGAAGNLTDSGFTSFVDSPLGPAFGKAGFDVPKMGHNHVKVPLATLTDAQGSFTVEAVFQFPATGVNADPDRAKFTLGAYGGEQDGPAGTSGGGFYLNYNGDADAAAQPGHVAGQSGRLQFVVDVRCRDQANAFSRKTMVNALVPVTAVPGHVYRAVAAWDNTTATARVGWAEVQPGATPDTLPAVTQVAAPAGNPGLVVDGTPYFLTAGDAESEDGGNGFAAQNVKIDDVRFVPGVDKNCLTAAVSGPTTR